jgi:hypothetical protein
LTRGGGMSENTSVKREPKSDPLLTPHGRSLRDLRDALLTLHKTLIDSERGAYEAVFGAIPTPNRFLQLLIGDPWFAWLRSISELIALIDEALDGKEPLTPEAAKSLVTQVRVLLKASDEGVGFAKQYYDALQRDTDVVLAHGDVQKLLAAL